jgi:hypothetical protein
MLSLGQQTATSDVLRVISSSQGVCQHAFKYGLKLAPPSALCGASSAATQKVARLTRELHEAGDERVGMSDYMSGGVSRGAEYGKSRTRKKHRHKSQGSTLTLLRL